MFPAESPWIAVSLRSSQDRNSGNECAFAMGFPGLCVGHDLTLIGNMGGTPIHFRERHHFRSCPACLFTLRASHQVLTASKSTIQDWVCAPIPILVVSVFSHTRATFEETDGFDPACIIRALCAPADTFQSEGVCAGLGPEVKQGEFPAIQRIRVKVKRPADLHTIEKCLKAAPIRGS
jgi:hypothetical protein